MRLSGPSSLGTARAILGRAGTTVLAVALFLPLAASPQQKLVRDGDRWVRLFYGTAPAGHRLRINAHGPVTFQGGASKNLQYTVRVSVMARTESQAHRALETYSVRLASLGEWQVLTAPGGPVISTVTVKAPRLRSVEISTSDSPVEASGVDGPLTVD